MSKTGVTKLEGVPLVSKGHNKIRLLLQVGGCTEMGGGHPPCLNRWVLRNRRGTLGVAIMEAPLLCRRGIYQNGGGPSLESRGCV